MSRSITIQATFKNNRSTTYGVHNPKNADMVKNPISFTALLAKKRELEAAIANKGIKKITLKTVKSGSKGHINESVKVYPSLANVSLKVLRKLYKAIK